MKYNELNLKKVRDDNDLDFAHYTYRKGQCSCCYNPTDLPKRYWKNNKILEKNYTYILFNNADNGSGVVKGTDEIKPYTCVNWRFPVEKLNDVGVSLQKQLPDNFKVLIPCGEVPHRLAIMIIDVTQLADCYEEELASKQYKAVDLTE